MNVYTVERLIEELEKRYPDKALLLDEMRHRDRIEYIAKLKLIVEIKTIIGQADDRTATE